MPWQFDNERPIYTQLLEKIRILIISGQYPAGSRLPSVRELASEAAVNPNTMQRALAELERSGLIYSQRTSGRYVTEDEDLVRSIRESVAQEKVRSFYEEMKQLGYSREEFLNLLNKDKGGSST